MKEKIIHMAIVAGLCIQLFMLGVAGMVGGYMSENSIAKACDSHKDPIINGVVYRCARVGE